MRWCTVTWSRSLFKEAILCQFYAFRGTLNFFIIGLDKVRATTLPPYLCKNFSYQWHIAQVRCTLAISLNWAIMSVFELDKRIWISYNNTTRLLSDHKLSKQTSFLVWPTFYSNMQLSDKACYFTRTSAYKTSFDGVIPWVALAINFLATKYILLRIVWRFIDLTRPNPRQFMQSSCPCYYEIWRIMLNLYIVCAIVWYLFINKH